MRNIIYILVATFLLCPLTALSNEKINFSDPNTVEQLISGKTWDCKMIDAYGESTGELTFKTVKGNKVKGSIKVPHLPVCDSDRLKGKLKKNKLKYMAPNGTPCREVNGYLDFFTTDAGDIEATGTYGVGGTHKRGSYVCHLRQ